MTGGRCGRVYVDSGGDSWRRLVLAAHNPGGAGGRAVAVAVVWCGRVERVGPAGSQRQRSAWW